jgi:hypothetical protein
VVVSQPLSGGNMSGALRVGDTVRRDAGPWTPTVHRLLEHLRAHGVPGVPKPHGLDQHGREVLEFLPGEVPSYPMPGWVWNDDLLVAAARWLRCFHDATTNLLRRDERWQLPDHPPVEVICHNDFAPYNMVFDAEHRLVGVIDFDTCSPGSRGWDLAYLAYRIVPFHAPGTLKTPTTAAARRIDRLELLCDAYGPPVQPGHVLAMLAVRVRDLYDFTAVRAAEAGPASELHRHLSSYAVDLAYLGELTTDE